jgi:hypothetical protein
MVVLRAIAADERLRRSLVLKGAYATEALTGIPRSTQDIDLTEGTDGEPLVAFEVAETARRLKDLFRVSVGRYCEESESDWRVAATSARPRPPRPHPFGWDGHRVNVTLVYRRRPQRLVAIDLSQGDLTAGTVKLSCDLDHLTLARRTSRLVLVGYSAEQIIAEKLRAFLQALRPYLEKIGANLRRPRPPRVQDIHDIAALHRARGSRVSFEELADSFRRKCAAKAVDCLGAGDFLPDPGSLDLYREIYEAESELARIPFAEAWSTMMGIVQRITRDFEPPGRFPRPTPRG